MDLHRRSTALAGLAAAALTTAGVFAAITPASADQRPSENPGTARMHELMREGNPGMARMHELMREGNPGMARMHERMTAGSGMHSGHSN